MTGGKDHKFKKLNLEAKVEGYDKFNIEPPSSPRKWSGFKNPRIVRVSRAFGGKDRHSKVTTTRGLRDRRIRLSLPTAVELYGLQDRLGLSQPSKVVDWLLDATQDEIDKLPPLQMAPGLFDNYPNNPTVNLDPYAVTTFPPFFNTNLSFLGDGASQSSMTNYRDEIRENLDFVDDDMMGIKSKAWDLDLSEQNQDESNCNPQVSALNFFPISSQSSFPNLVNNISIPYNSYHLEPNSNLSLSQFEDEGFQNDVKRGHFSPLESLQPSESHLYLCPTATTPSIFHPHPSYVGASSENDTRHVNMF